MTEWRERNKGLSKEKVTEANLNLASSNHHNYRAQPAIYEWPQSRQHVRIVIDFTLPAIDVLEFSLADIRKTEDHVSIDELDKDLLRSSLLG